jgi:hypothetical protein
LFYFFAPSNYELLAKVINACTFNNRFWVFSAATTNVEYALTVIDSQTGRGKRYVNPRGVSAPAVTDTEALAVCP